MGRPKNTQSIIDALKRVGKQKIHGYEKMEILVKGLWYNALPKAKDGSIALDGQGLIDLKAAQFITYMIDGKPKETKRVTYDIFKHFPEEEKKIDIDKYDVIEVEAEVVN